MRNALEDTVRHRDHVVRPVREVDRLPRAVRVVQLQLLLIGTAEPMLSEPCLEVRTVTNMPNRALWLITCGSVRLLFTATQHVCVCVCVCEREREREREREHARVEKKGCSLYSNGQTVEKAETSPWSHDAWEQSHKLVHRFLVRVEVYRIEWAK